MDEQFEIEVFRPGTFTPMSGTPLTFSAETLSEIAAAYDPAGAPAPAVVGHPTTDAPAFGWASGFRYDGERERLIATVGDLAPAFAEAVRAKTYRNVSMSFHAPEAAANPKPGTWYPKHIGFLGGAAPAVPGLKLVSFSGKPEDVVTIEFGDQGFRDTALLFRRMRDWMIEKVGLEKADEILPHYEIEWLSQRADDPAPGFTAPTDPEDDTLKIPPADFAAREAALTLRERQQAERDAVTRHAEHESFAESSRAMTAYGAAGSRSMAGLATAAAATAAAVALVGKNVISSAADFETGLSEIQKKAGTTREATAAIGEEIKALATSGQVASSIEELTAAYDAAAGAGIPLAEIEEYALLTAKGADAFKMSSADMGEFMGDLRFGMAQTTPEIEKTLDVINALADSGKAAESDIAKFVGNTGAQLKDLGFSTAEVAALGTTFLNIGVQQDVAATATGALATKLATIGTLSGKSRKTFEKFMGPVGKFSKLVAKDGNEAMMQIIDTMAKLSTADAAEFRLALVGLEHQDTLGRFVTASADYRRNLALAGEESKWMGSLDKSYALKLDTFWAHWQITKNSLETLSIDLGNMGMPALKAALVEVRGLVDETKTGLATFKAEVDWASVDEAGEAVGRLSKQLGDVLGIKTTDSAIPQFFKEMAQAVNQISDGLKLAEGFINRVTGDNPLELPPAPTSQAEADLQNYQDLLERVRADYEKRNWMKSMPAMNMVPDDFIGDRPSSWSLGSYDAANWDRALAEVKAQIASERFIGPMPVGGGGSSAPSPVADGKAGRVGSEVADIVGPLQVEGDAATAKALEIGQRIDEAVSVTAMPIIDVSSIDTATGKVHALAAAMRAMPNATIGAPAIPAAAPAATVAIDGARAAGGPVGAGGLYLVGERGPELFSPGSSGMIHTARDTSRLFQSGGSSGGGAGGGAGGGPIDASIHIGNVNVASPEGREDFEARLREHQRVIADMVQGEARRQSRTAF